MTSKTCLPRSQQHLVNFLAADLDLGFTFASMARDECARGALEHSQRSKQHAVAALTAVRRFLERVNDDEARSRFSQRADELERSMQEPSAQP